MRPSSRFMFCSLLAVASPILCAATPDAPAPVSMEQALILHVDGQLTIDSQGVPTEYLIKTKLPQNLSDSLQRVVRSWHFEPVLVGGNPVVAQTQMRVTLSAHGVGADYRVAVDNATFPQTRGQATDAAESERPVTISVSKRNTIEYPRAAIEHEIDADLVVYVKLTREGRVEQAFVAQTALLHVSGKPEVLGVATQIFEHQVLADVKNWRFKVVVNDAALTRLQATNPDDAASAFTASVPVEFRIQGHVYHDSQWQQVVRTDRRKAPWLPAAHAVETIGAGDLASGELVPAANRFRLTAAVAGTVL